MLRTSRSCEEDLRFSLSSPEQCCFSVDSTGAIIEWNHAAEIMFGLSADDVTGRICCDVVGHDLAKACAPCPLQQERARCHEVQQDIAIMMSPATGARSAVTVTTLPTTTSFGEHRIVHIVHPLPAWMTSDDVARMRATHEQSAGSSCGMAAPIHLTLREQDILRRLASGQSAGEIANTLCISKATTRNHIANILTKLGACTQLQAVVVATRQNLI